MFNLIKKTFSRCAIFSLFISGTAYSGAMGTGQPAESWHYLIAPYAWASSVNGSVMVRGLTEDIHISFIDVIKHLNFAAQGHIEGGYGPITLMIDPTYLKVSDKHQIRTRGLKITSQTVLIDAGVFYRLYSKPIAGNQFVSFELLGGARHLGIKNTLDFRVFSISDSTTMNAPIVGGRFKMDVVPKLNFWLRGDIGGFHVDHINQTWSTTAGLAYALKSNIDLGFAYRFLNIDYSKHNSAMNVRLHGPVIGISFHD